MEDMWQRNATLSETNLRMLEDEIRCDVTFLAGESQQAVKAHTYVLVSRSPVFYAMFCGAMAETSDRIPVPDIEADILTELLRYMYTTMANVTPETVMSLMYAANKYDVTALVTVCRDYLKDNTSPENVCTILEQAHAFDDKKLIEQCQKIIENHAAAVMDSDAFLLLSSTCLRSILSMTLLRTTEEHVYTNCVKWAQHECKRRGKGESDASCREVLGDMIYLIRFPCMSSDTFTKLTSNSGILSLEEKVDVLQHFCSKDIKCVLFNSVSRRKPADIAIKRFSGVKAELWRSNGGKDSVTISCSKDAILTGVSVYDDIKCTISVLQDNNTLIVSEISQRQTTSTGRHDIQFEKALYLKKNTLYKVIQDSYGKVSRYGIHGKSDVSVGDFSVSFSPGNDCTGQVPCLYFGV